MSNSPIEIAKRDTVNPFFSCYEFKNFDVQTLVIQSNSLKNNPLKDSSVRHNPILLPKKIKKNEKLNVVFILSGLGGNGPNSFSLKSYKENFPESIDRAYQKNEAPKAIYVFVNAMTYWGGSQFVNSKCSGQYEDYIIKEIVPAVKNNFPVFEKPNNWCIMGVSSGGYGSLHLSSKYPEIFGLCGALAFDGDFTKSLLPDFYSAASTLDSLGISGVKQEIEEGRFFRRKNAFKVQNAIAMMHCYSDGDGKTLKPISPVDYKTGELDQIEWKKWLKKDPVYFLAKRLKKIEKLKKIFIDVGKKDEFHLFFAARSVAKILKDNKIPLNYSEFSGGHFDMAPRKLIFWQWLQKEWSKK